jgi:hypothetical protein
MIKVTIAEPYAHVFVGGVEIQIKREGEGVEIDCYDTNKPDEGPLSSMAVRATDLKTKD